MNTEKPKKSISSKPINFMQADNTGEKGKQISSEATLHGGGVSSIGFSLGSLDKLIEERNKLLNDTKKFLQENGNSAQPAESSPKVPVTHTRAVIDVGTRLTETRFKNYEAIGELIKIHGPILGLEFFNKEISPLTKQIEASRVDFVTKFIEIKPSHPQFGKQLFDLENRVFKIQARIGLKIEEKLFDEVEKLNKDGRLSEGFFATYREVIKKP
jgi:hypothetical protein